MSLCVVEWLAFFVNNLIALRVISWLLFQSDWWLSYLEWLEAIVAVVIRKQKVTDLSRTVVSDLTNDVRVCPTSYDGCCTSIFPCGSAL